MVNKLSKVETKNLKRKKDVEKNEGKLKIKRKKERIMRSGRNEEANKKGLKECKKEIKKGGMYKGRKKEAKN